MMRTPRTSSTDQPPEFPLNVTPQEARKRLHRMQYENTAASHMLHAAQALALQDGLSEADSMAKLAYFLAATINDLIGDEIKRATFNVDPPKIYFCADCPKAPK